MCLFIMISTDFMTYLGFNGWSSLLPVSCHGATGVGGAGAFYKFLLDDLKEEPEGYSLPINLTFKCSNYFFYLFGVHNVVKKYLGYILGPTLNYFCQKYQNILTLKIYKEFK